MKFGFLVVALALALGAPLQVAAQTLEECVAAYDRNDYVTAFNLCRPLAERGNAEAQSRLGSRFMLGEGVPKDYAAAASWFRKAAEQGNANGQYNFGVSYYLGQGVPKDYAAAASWFRKAAEQGHAPGQFNLGSMYARGEGVPQDYAAALNWYRKAAEQGYASGQSALGYSYSNGEGVPQDYAAAVSWYRKAAEQGDAYAQSNLAYAYSNGKGVPQDYVQAHKWANLAASTATEADLRDRAVKQRDEVALLMTPKEVAKAQALASAFKAKPETPPAGSDASASNKQDDSGLITAMVLVLLAIGFVLIVALAARGAGATRQKSGREGQERAEKERADRERSDKERADKEYAEKQRAEQERTEKERADKQQSESARSKARKEKIRPWYEVLGVERDASAKDVMSAYRALIGKYHPDKVSGLGQEFQEIAERKAREINNAYAEYKRKRE